MLRDTRIPHFDHQVVQITDLKDFPRYFPLGEGKGSTLVSANWVGSLSPRKWFGALQLVMTSWNRRLKLRHTGDGSVMDKTTHALTELAFIPF